MIKLLVLCLLATLVTMDDTSDSEKSPDVTHPTDLSTPHPSTKTDVEKSPNDTQPTDHSTPHPSTKTDVEKFSNDTHPTHHSTPHPSTKTDAEKSPNDTHPTHHSTPHPSTKTDAEKSPEDTHLTNHSTPHPSAVTDGKTTSENTSHTGLPAAPLTCNCTTAGAGCHEHHCRTKESKRFCVTMAEENTLADGIRSVSVSRTCGDDVDLCNKTISINLNRKAYWRSNTTCCHNGDYCNSHSLKPPTAYTTQSTLVCPSCFAFNGSTCTLTRMKCLESETMCINVSGTVENGNSSRTFAGQGCATSSAKLIKNGTTLFFGNDTYRFTRIIVVDAKDGASQIPRSIPFTFLLSSLVGLLQAKFIY